MRGASQAAYSVTLPAEQVPGCFFSRMTRGFLARFLGVRRFLGVPEVLVPPEPCTRQPVSHPERAEGRACEGPRKLRTR
jgi:hypothetical protein